MDGEADAGQVVTSGKAYKIAEKEINELAKKLEKEIDHLGQDAIHFSIANSLNNLV